MTDALLNADWLARAPWHALDADAADFAPDGDANVAQDVVGAFASPNAIAAAAC